MDDVKKFILVIKILVSLFVYYLIMFKSDAGALVDAIGSVIVCGNYILGYINTFAIVVLYPLALHFLTLERVKLSKLKNKLLLFDIALILSALIGGILTSINLNQMPLEVALATNSVLVSGSAVLYMFLTFVVLVVFINLSEKK